MFEDASHDTFEKIRIFVSNNVINFNLFNIIRLTHLN